MSLIRLLAAGSSLQGIKDQRSPYKMTQQHLLPKFGASKLPEPQGAVVSPLPAPESIGPVRDPNATEASIPQPEPTQMIVAEAQLRTEPQRTTKARLALPPLWRWAQSKNPFRAKGAVRKRPPPVQGELLLEGVKVVRNDLNETDLEIVPAAAREMPKQLEGAQANPDGTRAVLSRVATRLFGERRT